MRPGLYSISVLKHYPQAEVTALDLNIQMLEKFKVKLLKRALHNRVKTCIDDITGSLYTLSDEKFDIIIAGGVLEYVQPAKAIQNLSKYLKQNSYFLFSPVSNNITGKIIGWLYKFKPYSKEHILQVLNENELALYDVVKTPGLLPVASAKQGYIFQKTQPKVYA